MRPPPCALRCGRAARMTWIELIRLVSICCRICAATPERDRRGRGQRHHNKAVPIRGRVQAEAGERHPREDGRGAEGQIGDRVDRRARRLRAGRRQRPHGLPHLRPEGPGPQPASGPGRRGEQPQRPPRSRGPQPDRGARLPADPPARLLARLCAHRAAFSKVKAKLDDGITEARARITPEDARGFPLPAQ
jgi:hypothetical protein